MSVLGSSGNPVLITYKKGVSQRGVGEGPNMRRVTVYIELTEPITTSEFPAETTTDFTLDIPVIATESEATDAFKLGVAQYCASRYGVAFTTTDTRLE